MYSTELIRKFPEEPRQPIMFVVYNEQHIEDAKSLIGTLHGFDYLEKHVTVVPYSSRVGNTRDYSVYIDPTVFTYKNSWNN